MARRIQFPDGIFVIIQEDSASLESYIARQHARATSSTVLGKIRQMADGMVGGPDGTVEFHPPKPFNTNLIREFIRDDGTTFPVSEAEYWAPYQPLSPHFLNY